MNIFLLDYDIYSIPPQLTDAHVLSTIMEGCEMLCLTHAIDNLLGFYPFVLKNPKYQQVRDFISHQKQFSIDKRTIPYGRKAHINHPCTIWTRRKAANFLYLAKLIELTNQEHVYRHNGTNHLAYQRTLDWGLLEVPYNLSQNTFSDYITEPYQAMPNHYKNDDYVVAYREYYRNEKYHLFKWSNRKQPSWTLSQY